MDVDIDYGPVDGEDPRIGGPPHSRKALIAAALVAVLAAAAAFYAVRSHLLSRPVDLRPATAALTSGLENVLRECQAPPEAIERRQERDYADAAAFWTHTEILLRVPHHLNAAGIAHAVRQEMTGQHVAVSDITDGSPHPALRLSLAGRPFATVHFEQAEAPLLPSAADPCRALRETVRELLRAHQIEAVEEDGILILDTPATQTPWETAARLSSALSAAGAAVTWTSEYESIRLRLAQDGVHCLTLVFHAPATPPPPQEELPLDPAYVPLEDPEDPEPRLDDEGAPPRIALIVDDGGYGGPATEAVLGLDARLTLAILPNTPHARTTTERALEAGFEVMLHMPMENRIDEAPFPGQVETDMPPEVIEAALHAALEDVPGASGVNNHTGSRFTEDAAAMEAFLRPLRELGLYFIDSRTTPNTVAQRTARSLGIPASRRHVFIDNENNGDAIRERFDELVDLALRQGYAVGIGHFRMATAEALAELLPTLDEKGIELVHASEIVQ